MVRGCGHMGVRNPSLEFLSHPSFRHLREPLETKVNVLEGAAALVSVDPRGEEMGGRWTRKSLVVWRWKRGLSLYDHVPSNIWCIAVQPVTPLHCSPVNGLLIYCITIDSLLGL
jgi:hypothetical protein